VTDSTRRNIYFPDDLWDEAQRAALKEGAARGVPVTVSEWVREAVQERLERTTGATSGSTLAKRERGGQ